MLYVMLIQALNHVAPMSIWARLDNGHDGSRIALTTDSSGSGLRGMDACPSLMPGLLM